MFRTRRQDEQGAMLVFTAISLVALLAIAGLVIDGSRLYSEHRQVQNAADAAALAGASALAPIISTSTGHESVPYAAVAGSIAANGTNNGFTCRLIDQAQNDLGACPTTNTGTGLPSTVAGVAVTAQDSQPGSFIKIVSSSNVGATATAKATAQKLIAGDSPFMICGRSDLDSDGQNPPLLLQSGSTWTINPAAVNQTYNLHGPQVPSCGAGSASFKGLVDNGNFTMPGWWDSNTGVKAGPVRQMLARPDACATYGDADNTGGCTMIVPIAVAGQANGSSAQMYCVAFGAFLVYPNGSNKHGAVFLGAAQVTAGQGGGQPTSYDTKVVKLVS